MDRISFINSKAKEKGKDYGSYLGEKKQEITWNTVKVGKEMLQAELKLVKWIQDKGYVKYKSNIKGNVRSFQKIFKDNTGKRYFINAHMYIKCGKDSYEIFWEYESYLRKKVTHEPVKMIFYEGWSLDEVESYLEKLWDTDLFQHYEKWS